MEKQNIFVTFSPNQTSSSPINPPSNKDTPLIWRLKQQLDQSYEEQKTITQSQSAQSQTLSLQIASSTSYNHSTSIMHQKSSKNSSTKTFMDVLQQKLGMRKKKLNFRRAFSKKNNSLRQSSTLSPESTLKLRQFRYQSSEKNKITQLKKERSNILHQIDEKLSQQYQSRQIKVRDRCCTCGKSPKKQTVKRQMTDKTSQTVSTSHRLSTQSVVEIQSVGELSNQTTVVLQSPKQSKMMKNIIQMKQKLRNERQNVQLQQKQETVEWYQLPEHLLPEEQQLFQTLKDHQHKTVSFKHVSEYGNSDSRSAQSQSLTKVLQCLLTNQFLSESKGDDSKGENMFTFGELQRSRMKAQLEMIKKHMKKVSIELEEKQNIGQHHKKRSA